MNQTINQIDLPQRLRESSFRKYEDDIASIVAKFPGVVVINHYKYNSNASTISSRLRDAMLSLYRFHWQSTQIDINKFRLEYHNIIVSHRIRQTTAGWESTILVGSKNEIRDFEREVIIEGLEPTTEPIELKTIDGSDHKEITTICDLVAKRLINQPLRVVNLNPKSVSILESNFDVRLDANEDGSYTLL